MEATTECQLWLHWWSGGDDTTTALAAYVVARKAIPQPAHKSTPGTIVHAAALEPNWQVERGRGEKRGVLGSQYYDPPRLGPSTMSSPARDDSRSG